MKLSHYFRASASSFTAVFTPGLSAALHSCVLLLLVLFVPANADAQGSKDWSIQFSANWFANNFNCNVDMAEEGPGYYTGPGQLLLSFAWTNTGFTYVDATWNRYVCGHPGLFDFETFPKRPPCDIIFASAFQHYVLFSAPDANPAGRVCSPTWKTALDGFTAIVFSPKPSENFNPGWRGRLPNFKQYQFDWSVLLQDGDGDGLKKLFDYDEQLACWSSTTSAYDADGCNCVWTKDNSVIAINSDFSTVETDLNYGIPLNHPAIGNKDWREFFSNADPISSTGAGADVNYTTVADDQEEIDRYGSPATGVARPYNKGLWLENVGPGKSLDIYISPPWSQSYHYFLAPMKAGEVWDDQEESCTYTQVQADYIQMTQAQRDAAYPFPAQKAMKWVKRNAATWHRIVMVGERYRLQFYSNGTWTTYMLGGECSNNQLGATAWAPTWAKKSNIKPELVDANVQYLNRYPPRDGSDGSATGSGSSSAYDLGQAFERALLASSDEIGNSTAYALQGALGGIPGALNGVGNALEGVEGALEGIGEDVGEGVTEALGGAYDGPGDGGGTGDSLGDADDEIGDELRGYGSGGGAFNPGNIGLGIDGGGLPPINGGSMMAMNITVPFMDSTSETYDIAPWTQSAWGVNFAPVTTPLRLAIRLMFCCLFTYYFVTKVIAQISRV